MDLEPRTPEDNEKTPNSEPKTDTETETKKDKCFLQSMTAFYPSSSSNKISEHTPVIKSILLSSCTKCSDFYEYAKQEYLAKGFAWAQANAPGIFFMSPVDFAQLIVEPNFTIMIEHCKKWEANGQFVPFEDVEWASKIAVYRELVPDPNGDEFMPTTEVLGPEGNEPKIPATRCLCLYLVAVFCA